MPRHKILKTTKNPSNIEMYQKMYPIISLQGNKKLLFGPDNIYEVDLSLLVTKYEIDDKISARLSKYGVIIFCYEKNKGLQNSKNEYIAKITYENPHLEIQISKEAGDLGLGPKVVEVLDCTVHNKLLKNSVEVESRNLQTSSKSQIFVMKRLSEPVDSTNMTLKNKEILSNLFIRYLNNPSTIVHGDMSINNMMFHNSHDVKVAYLIDWGKSQHISDNNYRLLLRLRDIVPFTQIYKLYEVPELRELLGIISKTIEDSKYARWPNDLSVVQSYLKKIVLS